MKGVRGAVGLGVVVAMLAAFASAAVAKSGWQIRHFAVGSSYSFSGQATRCSASKFGRYRYVGEGSVTLGNKTRSYHETGWIKLLSHHRLGRAHLSKITGNALSAQLKREVKNLVNNHEELKVVSLNGDAITIRAYIDGQAFGKAKQYKLHSAHC